MQKLLPSTAALSVLLVSSAAASADEVETVVITATRTEQPAEKTGASLSLITAEDLKTQQTVVLSDILKEVPSLIINRTGGVGQVTTVSIRGAEQGQTVTLIDGIRINDPSDGSEGAIYGDVLANNISRVEILRGPQSTLYGSDAIGGVVNIISKRGGGAPFALDASAEGGSFGTFHANVAANGTTDAVEYGAALNYYTTTGVSAADSAQRQYRTRRLQKLRRNLQYPGPSGRHGQRRRPRLLHQWARPLRRQFSAAEIHRRGFRTRTTPMNWTPDISG